MNLWQRLMRRVAQLLPAGRSAACTRWWRGLGSALGVCSIASVDAAERHRERVDEDPAYARTIATAVSELVATMVPRPTLATTIAVALAGSARPDPHQHRPGRRGRRDARDPYRGYRRRQPAVPPAVPGSLWDRLH